ncbi:MAG: hypothetical protein AAF228_07750 [Pseudomonadota bacterium]
MSAIFELYSKVGDGKDHELEEQQEDGNEKYRPRTDLTNSVVSPQGKTSDPINLESVYRVK